MATTSPDNIWSPDSGDDYALTVDLAAMADTVQDAINDNRVGRIGTNAERLALTGTDLFEGLTFRTTDTRYDWVYTGGVWQRRMAPYGFAKGTVNTPSSGYLTVNFPAGTFSVAPSVVASNGLQANIGVSRVINVTATSFQVGIWAISGVQIAGSGVSWIAIQ